RWEFCGFCWSRWGQCVQNKSKFGGEGGKPEKSTQYGVLGTEYSVRSTRYGVLSTEYSVLSELQASPSRHRPRSGEARRKNEIRNAKTRRVDSVTRPAPA